MSAILGNMRFRVDENDAEKYLNVKKVGGGDGGVKATDVPKRAALGELQNRALPRAGAGKDAAQKETKDPKVTAVRATKPRVDTYWKKGELPGNALKSANSPTKGANPTRSAALPAVGGIMTRSNSLRLGTGKTATTSNGTAATRGIQRNVIGTVQAKENKTVAKKTVESKVQQEKKEKVLPIDAKLKREDSNISRKSLTKLKAALAREAKTETGKSQANTVVVIETKSNQNKILSTVEPSHSTELIKEDVRDIDKGDNKNLILVSEYANDIYEYLFQLENEQPIRKNHLANQQAVTPKMRSVLLDWINEVHSQFHLAAETFHMTVGIIDRYLQIVNDTKRTHLQLVGVTALFLAAKYEELYPPAMADFIYMTDHSYNQQQILEMEIRIFRALDCNLSRPVSIHFLRRFSKAADIEDFQHAMSKYFLELASIEYELASYKPSEIAAASLFLSLHMSKGDPRKPSGFDNSHWNPTLEHYSHYTAEHLRPITRKIASIARQAPDAKLNAVYTKYQSSKLYKASLRPVLYSALMDSIIENDD